MAAFAHISDVEDDSESEVDEEEAHRLREREKIRLLKKKKIRTCGLKLPGLRIEGSNAVFVRHDVEDESVDVDISLDQDHSTDHTSIITPHRLQLLKAPSRFSRTRRPTIKKHNAIEDPLLHPRLSKTARKDDPPKPLPPNYKQLEQVLMTEPSPKHAKEPGKPKSETYKQAWSVSEQHLLEQLLEQIPEGEKYR